MCAAAILGGYYGARVVRQVPPRAMRVVIVALGTATTIGFFLRQH
jgi:uncharacterized membrane protein YfcA